MPEEKENIICKLIVMNAIQFCQLRLDQLRITRYPKDQKDIEVDGRIYAYAEVKAKLEDLIKKGA